MLHRPELQQFQCCGRNVDLASYVGPSRVVVRLVPGGPRDRDVVAAWRASREVSSRWRAQTDDPAVHLINLSVVTHVQAGTCLRLRAFDTILRLLGICVDGPVECCASPEHRRHCDRGIACLSDGRV